MAVKPKECERRIVHLECVFPKSCASKYCCYYAAYVCISGVPPREQRKLCCWGCTRKFAKKYGVEWPCSG